MAGTSDGDDSRSTPVPRLPLARYRVRFEALDPVRLSGYSGSAWRGALGHALKRTVCVTRLPVCSDCLLYHACAYPYLFETPPPPGSRKMRLYPAAPHPFVLAPSLENPYPTERGEVLDLPFALIGRASAYLPYFVHALARAGEKGLGRARSRLKLIRAEQEASPGQWTEIYGGEGSLKAEPPREPVIPPPPPRILLEIRTPLRIQEDGHNVRPESFGFAQLFRSLLRRISMLTYFHTDTPLETDFRELTRLATEVSLAASDLRWYDWTRYSSRQLTKMELGGLLGSVEFHLDPGSPLWPYVWLGQFTHGGKATSMGLGRYEIAPASLRDRQDAEG